MAHGGAICLRRRKSRPFNRSAHTYIGSPHPKATVKMRTGSPSYVIREKPQRRQRGPRKTASGITIRGRLCVDNAFASIARAARHEQGRWPEENEEHCGDAAGQDPAITFFDLHYDGRRHGHEAVDVRRCLAEALCGLRHLEVSGWKGLSTGRTTMAAVGTDPAGCTVAITGGS